jgi:hydrogenase-1 operon protein HyaE
MTMPATIDTPQTPVPAAPAPGDPQAAALVCRLVQQFGATWVDRDSHDAFTAGAGTRVLFFSGDAVRFPESLDVAVVLPELQAALRPGTLQVGVVVRRDEDALARRWGSQRWPALVFLRDGQYLATVNGMHDWTDYLSRVQEALAATPSRAPGVGIPVVSAGTASGAPDSACH